MVCNFVDAMKRALISSIHGNSHAEDVLRHLFLDLEDTVITPVVDGWFNTHPINAEKIKAFIAKFQPHFIHIFSFAIWNQEELKRFNLGTRPMIEQALGVSLSHVPTVDDEILPACISVAKLHHACVTFSDMSDFWGKHEAFRLNMRHMFKSGQVKVEVALLDDMVYNEAFEWPDLKVKGHILNIDQLGEPNGSPTIENPPLGNT